MKNSATKAKRKSPPSPTPPRARTKTIIATAKHTSGIGRRTARKKPVIAIVHYSCPPVIGGVEFVIESHARLMANEGLQVRVVVGRGGTMPTGVETRVVPSLRSDGGPNNAVVAALNNGKVHKDFAATVKRIEADLKKELASVDVCIVHNMMTMHFNLAATAALANLMAKKGRTRFIAWCHDSTFTDSNYRRHQHDDYPWNLLKRALPGCRYGVISKQRQKEFSKLLGLPRQQLPVFSNGVSVTSLLGLTPQARTFYRDEKIFDKDIVAITPTRIVRRKNLETGLEIVAALKAMGTSLRWIVTGAPDTHNDDSQAYYRELVCRRKELGLEKEAVFLCERFEERISNNTLRAFMSFADILIFPSKKEGFGIPVLEAGLADLIMILNDIPALREIAGSQAVYIPKDYNPKVIAKLAIATFRKSQTLKFRKKILREYSWPAVFRKTILPVLMDPDSVWPEKPD